MRIASRIASRVLWFVLPWTCATASAALDLSSVVERTLRNDPSLRAVAAQRDATSEQRTQGIAQLLPQINFQATQSDNTTDSSTITGSITSPLVSNQYKSDSKTAVLRQAIFRPRLIFNALQGNLKALVGQAQLEAAQQKAIARAVSAYAGYLAKYEGMRDAQAEHSFGEFRLRQAERMRTAGEISDVDVAGSLAALAGARVRLKEASIGFASARRELASMTGLTVPESAGEITWLRAAEQVFSAVKSKQKEGLAQLDTVRNPELKAQELALEVTRLELKKVASDHSPTLDGIASLSEGTSAVDIAIGRYTRTWALGFQLNIPIFAGGATQSSVRENAALVEKGGYDLEAVRIRVENDRLRTLEEIDLRLEAIDAALAELKSAELGLHLATQGLQAGINSEVDVADRRVKARRAVANLARAVTDTIVSYVQHLVSLGALGAEEVQPLSAALSMQ